MKALSGDSLAALSSELQNNQLPFDNVVPEPSTLALLAVGGVAIGLCAIRSRKRYSP